MKTKKIIVLVAILFFVSLFAGCKLFAGDDNGNNSSDDEQTEIQYTELSTEEELKNLANSNGNYKLKNDISLTASWKAIDGFSGRLDGDNHSITGLNISGNSSNIGLFSTLKGHVSDLTIKEINITATGDAGTVGAVCGTNDGVITNVTVCGTINTPYFNNVGGVCGMVSAGGSIKNCINEVTLNGYKCVGGICGYYKLSENGIIENNSNKAKITGKERVGGIVGQIQCASSKSNSGSANFTNNSNTAEITSKGEAVGGVVGYQASDSVFGSHYTYLNISGCSNTAIVSGGDYTGGLVGYGDYLAQIAFSNNDADISGDNFVGGYMGYGKNTAIKNAINENEITGKGYVGGIVGKGGALSDCTNNGNIVSTTIIVEGDISKAHVGGIAGYATAINGCENNSDIKVLTGGRYVGGLVGFLYVSEGVTCADNINNGKIEGESYVGGIVGEFHSAKSGSSSGVATLTDCKNTAAVKASGEFIGGLIGYQVSDSQYGSHNTYLSVSSCSNTATVSGGDYTGGLVGYGKQLSQITSSTNFADISGGNFVGGYLGCGDKTSIRIAVNENTVTGKGYLGGIAGYCGDLYDCTNNGTVTSTDAIVENSISKAHVGGIAGYATLINDCINNSEIIVLSGGRYVGGIVGYLYVAENGTCAGNHNYGEIRGADYTGGIVGELHSPKSSATSGGFATFKENSNNAAVRGAGDNVGGLIGYQTSDSQYGTRFTTLTISSCSNKGYVLGINYVGGIIGYGAKCVTNSAVWSSNSNVGIVEGSSNAGNMYGYIA